MVTNPYDIDALEEDVKRNIRKFTPDEIEDFDAGEYVVVVDTLAEGTDLTHMNGTIADKFGLELPEGVESWEDYEDATEVVEDAERDIIDDLNDAKSLPGTWDIETNEGFGDRQLVFRFPSGTFPAWEGTCISVEQKEELIRQLEAVRETHKIPELDELLERLKKLPACND